MRILEMESLAARQDLLRLRFLRGVMSGTQDVTETLSQISWYIPAYSLRIKRSLYQECIKAGAFI